MQADTSAPVTIRTRKFITNRLLARRQFIVDVLHPNRPNVSKAELSEKLAQIYKADKARVVTFGLKTAFGGGRSTGFGLIYDDEASQKKFEPKYRLIRVRLRLSSSPCCYSRQAGGSVWSRDGTTKDQPQASQGAEEPCEEGQSALPPRRPIRRLTRSSSSVAPKSPRLPNPPRRASKGWAHRTVWELCRIAFHAYPHIAKVVRSCILSLMPAFPVFYCS